MSESPLTAGIWETAPTLDEILERIFIALENGASSSKHPFHLATLGTISNSAPNMRTVVLRKFSRTDLSLLFHTHSGSPKVEEVRRNPEVGWLFYDQEKGLQLRIAGHATIHIGDSVSDERWNLTTRLGKRCYLAEPSGRATTAATSGLPFDPRSIPKDLDVEPGRGNFAVIATKITNIDCLELDVRGHRRSNFSFSNDEHFSSWVTP